MTAQMTAQSPSHSPSQSKSPTLPLTFFEPEFTAGCTAQAELEPDFTPQFAGDAVATGIAAHVADLLFDRPATIAPWNVRSGDAREHSFARAADRTVSVRHLHLVADPSPVATRDRSSRLRTVVAGLALAGLVALASIGLLAFLGADAAASTPASSTGATPTAAAVAATPVAVAESVAPTAPQWIVVQSGDSLWSVARRLQPKGDVRRLVDRIAARLGGASITAGQRIDVSGLVD